MSTPVLRIGILGATDAVETTYLPTLISLKSHFSIIALQSSNPEALKSCQKLFAIPSITTSPEEILSNAQVDVILNLFPFEHHEKYTIAALESGKHVMVEVPLSMTIDSLRRIRAATKKGLLARSPDETTSAPRVFVGCARRYAPCFTDIFKKELATLPRIYYARCRNISGPLRVPKDGYVDKVNELHGSNDPSGNEVSGRTSQSQFQNLLVDIFGSDGDITPERVAFCQFLGSLGCHDLSLMRESLGFPDAVSCVSITDPFYSAVFHYTDDSSSDGNPFTLLYEAGVDTLPRCDAHLTVYGARKTLSVVYDFPHPGEAAGEERSVKVIVEEVDCGEEMGNGNGNGNGNATNRNGNETAPSVVRPRVKRTEYVSSCNEAYDRELRALHSYLTGGNGPEAKTTPEDALSDLRLLHMIFGHYDRQCGTIRTPLG
ncbi:UQCRX like ubiquinol-cytochrome C reductase family protein [Penicillium atrosanguineum]|uniref:Gfo/Idh/MocA-like oxidoreductase N-terminal domain-containing protein n=1 Tax=Penicillium atrosanguineum TaxID=1132637 RepID=A0A9W9U024_9EURO|nr:UQCRX like ubiquinol-cytochrome C reductase family protein [Penicillium atrosanguineum]KAJ5126015.1 hypothetical protein N7526_008192 [Penicillium atrosanguineum]KAJ5293101.1 UQCRX like ubiquinol-cytochrome C reductase family protein [Penicillium atrosanguineum]KAJ5302862.1 hypothetical protein N7476_009661 [Penicillium atrosanguineum]